MTTLIVGSTSLADDLGLALQYGGADHLQLVRRGAKHELAGAEVEPTPNGLVTALREHEIREAIDASEPFAEGLSDQLADACMEARVPLLRAVPESFEQLPGADGWTWVDTWVQASRAVADRGGTVLVALDPLELCSRLSDLGRTQGVVHRRRRPGEPKLPSWAREPTRPLGGGHRLDLLDGPPTALLTADSGDFATRKLLEAADANGIPIVAVRRPSRLRASASGGAVNLVASGALAALHWRTTVTTS